VSDIIPGFLEHCEERWRYVQAANSGAINREMERRLFFWAIRRYGHPAYRHPDPSRSRGKSKVFKNFLIASCLVLMASVASAQPIVANPVVFTWDANAASDQVVGYRVIVDNSITDVGNVTSFSGAFPAGTHTAAVLAYNATGVSKPSSPPLAFTVQAQAGDPACLPPLGAHAPAIFPTSPTLTTGKPGSRSFLNYQLGGPDTVVEVAVQIDGVDAVVGKGTDLAAFSGMWFTQPAAGSHTLGVRVLTSFGCTLTKQTSSPLVVKP
jgi:hypothetical protein